MPNLLSEILPLTPYLVGWIMTSLFLYIAGKIVARKYVTFGEALMVALIGPFIVGVTILLTSIFLGPMLSFIASLAVWMYTIKSIFDVGWGAAFLISITASLTLIGAIFLSSYLLGIVQITLFPFLAT